MSPMPVFEDGLTDWLEEGPTDAPDRVLDIVLAAFPSIRQRRVAPRGPWGFPPLNGYARSFAGIAVVAGVVFVGFFLLNSPPTSPVGGPALPSPSPSISSAASARPSSISTAEWATFTSQRHGVAVRYPADWRATRATAGWPAGGDPADPPSPMLDTFVSPTGVTVVVVSQPLPSGVTGQAWLTDRELANARRFPTDARCWPAPSAMERVTVNSAPTWLHGDCGKNEAIAFLGGRVYEITQYPDPTYNRALFDAFLSTVRFDPTSADDSPVSSASPNAK